MRDARIQTEISECSSGLGNLIVVRLLLVDPWPASACWFIFAPAQPAKPDSASATILRILGGKDESTFGLSRLGKNLEHLALPPTLQSHRTPKLPQKVGYCGCVMILLLLARVLSGLHFCAPGVYFADSGQYDLWRHSMSHPLTGGCSLMTRQRLLLADAKR